MTVGKEKLDILASNILDLMSGLLTTDKEEKGCEVGLIGGNSILRQTSLDCQILQERIKICIGLVQMQVR